MSDNLAEFFMLRTAIEEAAQRNHPDPLKNDACGHGVSEHDDTSEVLWLYHATSSNTFSQQRELLAQNSL
jgi:hypothetical protein